MGRVEINTKVINKHDTEANWNSHPSFIPDKSEIIVYDKDNNYNYPRVKIGDGVTNIVALPFIDDNTLTSVNNLQTEVNNVKASTSDEAINTKVNNAIQDIGALTVDLNNAESGSVPFTNSDMLGGLPASSYLQVADFPQALTDAGVVKSIGGKVPNASGEVVLVPVDIGAVPTSRTVNGKALSSDISLTYSDIGAAAASHTHSYLPLSGGTMTGDIFMNNAKKIYWEEPGYGDKFAIEPYFNGVDDDNKLRILGAVGGAGTNPNFTELVTIAGKTGTMRIGGNVVHHDGNLSFSLSGTTLTITKS